VSVYKNILLCYNTVTSLRYIKWIS